MEGFQKILLRFKEHLGIQTDKEVAELLGMSPTAFNDRKKRNTFPEDKLLALKVRRPDLLIDEAYILRGNYRSVEEAINKTKEHQAKQTGLRKTLEKREQDLLTNYRAATDSGKLAIEATARAVEKLKTRR